jgi:hypothetical protein
MKKPKYQNEKVTVLGIKFDSKKESLRYQELLLMVRAGEITDLKLQPVFVLAPSVVINGRKKPELKYIADFSYMEAGYLMVEDVKSEYTKTLPVYRIKAHLMKHIHGIEITEI